MEIIIFNNKSDFEAHDEPKRLDFAPWVTKFRPNPSPELKPREFRSTCNTP